MQQIVPLVMLVYSYTYGISRLPKSHSQEQSRTGTQKFTKTVLHFGNKYKD